MVKHGQTYCPAQTKSSNKSRKLAPELD